MKTLRITLPASQDLNDITDYFLAQSIEAGDRFVTAFNQRCIQLARYPYIGKSYAHLRPNLRGLGLMNYLIFYRVIDDHIEILRVISGYRNLQEIFADAND
ncbi:type II toxin-antitoxin system RelE/ParE family toxin [Leptolyngbya sp. O-77]|uniref:type II toxin-antitoxin system RelE/ParE family toxin n=1 Tax=Leptolyngbya sp. O-77 TaxID=1080068 RepID=UPI00074D2A2B|nr:type II toxin-antitoxin system RelE/ParE family toxin [Leptolyngbya sp. O-77]BAU42561.1 Plasmid stabilization system protein [Leptolyngbya sp. O-77]